MASETDLIQLKGAVVLSEAIITENPAVIAKKAKLEQPHPEASPSKKVTLERKGASSMKKTKESMSTMLESMLPTQQSVQTVVFKVEERLSTLESKVNELKDEVNELKDDQIVATPSKTITISVKVTPTNTWFLAVSSALTVIDLKMMIQAKYPNMKDGLLLHNNKQLDNKAQLSDYAVKHGDALVLPGSLTLPEMGAAMKDGMRVKRGRDWWSDDDIRNNDKLGGGGTVTQELHQGDGGGWVGVRWDNGCESVFAMGSKGQYDLQLA